jgi:hypothetical protein
MTTENEAAVRGLIKAFGDSWNHHDMGHPENGVHQRCASGGP